MVVTRRTSNIPTMPPTSRTNSAQATPRVNKGKAPQTSTLAQELEPTLVNGDGTRDSALTLPDGPQFSDDVIFSKSPSKSKSKGKPKKKAREKPSGSFVDLLARMFLLFFLIYSLSVCPSDKDLQSPICRGLSEYRRLILDPYVFRPFQNTLQHPSVSPYVTPVIKTAKPVISRSQQEWSTRVVPQWNKHVVPQWRMRVSPQIARLSKKTEPYRQTLSAAYDRTFAPYVVHVERYTRKARPYVLLTAAKTYDTYQVSKPYLARVSTQLQRLPPLFIKFVLKPSANARRQFVDPHVALLVEKIKELSTGTGKPAKPARETAQEGVIPPAWTPKADLNSEDHDEHAEVELPSVPEPTEENGPLSSASSVVSASMSLGDEASVSVPGATYSPTPEPELPHAEIEQEGTKPGRAEITEDDVLTETQTKDSDVAETSSAETLDEVTDLPGSVYEPATESASSLISKASEGAEHFASSASSIIASETRTESLSSIAEQVTGRKPPHSLVPPSGDADGSTTEIDLDAFYAELDLDAEESAEIEAGTATDSLAAAPSVVEETEEEKAERLRKKAAETAEKRRKLEERHAKWEDRLQQTIKDQKKTLRKALVGIRKAAAADLKASQPIRDEVEKLHAEAEKALRGTEAYFAKLKKGDKARDEKLRLWDRVLSKVEAKFSERVTGVEMTVSTWYKEVLAKEVKEVEAASTAVKTVAEDGQADIGLDYAWLDDVTYMDWKRYHALLDTHKGFVHQALSIQNGSHPSPPINPVIDALNDLQSEVHDITVGFETRLRRMKREGERAFATDEPLNDVVDETVPGDEPVVSILPISGDGTSNGKSEEKVLQEVSDAILGRSEEEIAAALGRAMEQEKVVHEEL